VNPVNPAISAFDLTDVWFTARTEICPALLCFFHSSLHCSRLLSTTLQARRGASQTSLVYVYVHERARAWIPRYQTLISQVSDPLREPGSVRFNCPFFTPPLTAAAYSRRGASQTLTLCLVTWSVRLWYSPLGLLREVAIIYTSSESCRLLLPQKTEKVIKRSLFV